MKNQTNNTAPAVDHQPIVLPLRVIDSDSRLMAVDHPRLVRRRAINKGFWDRPPEDRAAAMDAACERGGMSNFFDLSPEERGAAYDREY